MYGVARATTDWLDSAFGFDDPLLATGPAIGGLATPSLKMRNEAGFWAMLIAAYVIFALALAGSRFLNRIDETDPSPQLVQ